MIVDLLCLQHCGTTLKLNLMHLAIKLHSCLEIRMLHKQEECPDHCTVDHHVSVFYNS